MDPHAPTDNVWIRLLMEWWLYYNRLYLRGALRSPALALDRAGTRLGQWDGTTRTLSISARHLQSDPWLEVMETLRHEMAHQYAEEVLGAAGDRPHGEAFALACEHLAVDPRAHRAATRESSSDVDRVIARVQKLLSLGSSPNENEAQAALTKARELLLRHNLDPARLRSERRFGVRWLGEVKARHALWEQVLGGLLGEFFFVGVIWVQSHDVQRDRDGTVLEVMGTPENLEMASYVHGFLVGLLEPLWSRYKQRVGLHGDRERLRYYAGVVQGFRAKLRAEDRDLRRSHALVWKGDPGLAAYQSRRHPSTRSRRTGTGWSSQAQEDGRRDGRHITLRRPIRGDSAGFGGYLTG